MSLPVTLSEIRNQVRQRADMVNSTFVTNAELKSFINQSGAELYDLLIQHFGDDYYFSSSSISIVSGTNSYALPSDFYKMRGLDIVVSNTDKNTVPKFNFQERNQDVALTGDRYNIKYMLQGQNIKLVPTPTANYTATLWYIPAFIPLDSIQSSSVTQANPAVYTVPAPHYYVANQQIKGVSSSTDTYNVLQVIASKTATTITTDLNSTSLGAPSIKPLLENTLDGVSGWEEYIIVDAAIKCLQKEESDVTVLLRQKERLLTRIETAAQNRDAGEAKTLADVQNRDVRIYGYGGYY